MKKILLGLGLCALLSNHLNAGMWSTAQGFMMKEKKPTATYTIDTAGINPRVYEFNTVDKTMKCVVIFTTVKGGSASSLQCIKINSK